MARLKFTILGCGSSGGVPRLSDVPGGDWGACDPTNPRNARRRCSLLVQRYGEGEIPTTVLIDTSPDLRAQLLDAGIGRLDGVVYTHAHADHVHGIDDLRMIGYNIIGRLPVWADGATSDALLTRFSYAFVQPKGSPYPPILDLNPIDGPIHVDGPGGRIALLPFDVNHGTIDALGLRIGNLAYVPDVAEIPDAARPMLTGLDCWIVDALRRTPHPTHAHLAKALDWIADYQPKQAVLTNMHFDLDYEAVRQETPDHVTPAFDGMTLEFDA